jgi:hydrogenase maturation protease
LNNLKNQKEERYGGGDSDIPSPKITILGVGNELLSDEGVGAHIARELEKLEIPPGVEVYEGGTHGFGLLNLITDTDYLIVIDSLKGGGEPGSIYRFNIEEAPECPDMFKTSVHRIGILEVINLSGLIGKTPEVIVFGIEPKTIGTGMELSPEVRAKVPRVIELVLEEVNKFPAARGATEGTSCHLDDLPS